MLETSDIIAIVAVAISIASLAASFYAIFLDRPRLKVSSKYFGDSEYGSRRIVVTFVNVGRRPVILRLFGGHDETGDWVGSFLGKEEGGLRLGEHERHEFTIRKEDTVQISPEGDIFFVQMWVEDSLGVRHPIPSSEKHIKLLWGQENPNKAKHRDA